ncbi:MAG: apolipoprotein N-acyltransferase [Cyanobacteria bacterium P01_H01_bin.119]
MKTLPQPKPPRLSSPWSWATGVLMLGSGLLMGTAPEPLNIWPLAWVAIAPLWFIRLQTVHSAPSTAKRWRRLAYPFLWGLGYHGLALAWITHLHPLTWMGIPWLGSIAIALFAWAFITLLGTATVVIWFGLSGWLWRLQPCGRPNLALGYRLLTAIALWCALETLLSWGPLAWTFIGYTQSPTNLWILQWGRLSGQLTVTAILLLFNGLLAEVLQRQLLGQSRSGRQMLGTAMALWLVAHGIGWGLQQSAIADRPTEKLTLGMIQGNIPTSIKLTPAGERQAMERYTQGYERLVAQGVDGVITPEAALPILWQRQQQYTPLYQALRRRQIPLWLGTFAIAAKDIAPNGSSGNLDRSVNPAPALTQTLLSLDGSGTITGRYDKVKLVPLGEYIPFESVLGKVIQRLSSMGGSLAPGDGHQVFNTPLAQAIVGICYESPFGELFRRQAAAGGELIVTASNNDPYPPAMMHQHHAQDVMRAIETDRWAIRVTNTGLSGLVDAQGRTRWLGEPNKYLTYAATLYRRHSQTPYVRWGDWLTPLLGAIASVTAIYCRIALTRSN